MPLIALRKVLQRTPIREHGATLVEFAHAKYASPNRICALIRSHAPKQVLERAQYATSFILYL